MSNAENLNSILTKICGLYQIVTIDTDIVMNRILSMSEDKEVDGMIERYKERNDPRLLEIQSLIELMVSLIVSQTSTIH